MADDRANARDEELTRQAAADVADRYQLLVEHSPDGICVHEAGRIVYANPAAIRFVEAESADRVVGRLISEFVAPESIPGMFARLESLTEHAAATEPSEASLMKIDGGTVAIELVSARTVWEGRLAYQVIMRDLSAQKAAEAALRFQAALVSHVTDAIIATTHDGVVTSWNPAAETIYGMSADSAIGQTATEVVGATLDPAAIVRANGVVRATHRHANGSALAVRVSAAAMDGGYVLVCTDQTALRKAEAHFTTVVSGLEESVLVVGQNGSVISANPAALRLLESLDWEIFDQEPMYSARSLYDADGNVVPAQDHPIATTFRTRRPITGSIFGIDRADGERVWLEGTCSLLDPDDPLSPVLASFSDITEQLAIKHRLEYEATHDPLTGLANRTFVLARLGAALNSLDPRPLAIAFIDLDDFKVINDSLGHNVGDTVLAIAAQRIRGVVRRNDLVGRLGGDEFIALLLDNGNRGDTDRLIKRIREALIEPISAGSQLLRIDASIGVVTVAAGDSRTAEDLLRDADIAMYQAKKTGSGRTEYFTAAY